MTAHDLADIGTDDAPGTVRLRGEALTLGYDGRTVAADLTVQVPPDSFTVLIGPNASGKSTLLRALARVRRPRGGAVLLDGHDIHALPARRVARTLGLLPQSPIAPGGITVAELVARGRHPHQSLLRQWSRADERIVTEAMTAAGIAHAADSPVDELSGGQRQQAWIALVLAQQTSLLLLDEPTTYLDIGHQVAVLDLCAELHREGGRTLVAALHDLNQAARYATHLIVLHDGRIAASGDPAQVLTAELVEEVFRLRCRIIADPHSATPLVIPIAPADR